MTSVKDRRPERRSLQRITDVHREIVRGALDDGLRVR